MLESQGPPTLASRTNAPKGFVPFEDAHLWKMQRPSTGLKLGLPP